MNPLNQPSDTRLTMDDFYTIELALSDAGKDVNWEALIACETVGDLAGMVGEV